MRDVRKFIIGVVQDYCNNHGYTYESEHFALSAGYHFGTLIQTGQLSIDVIKKQLLKYKIFINGNDIDAESFAIELFKEIQRKEPFIPAKSDIYEVIKEFKLFVEGNVYQAFHISDNPQEETGRSLVQTYLRPRGFREAEMGGGNSDLIYPNEETIIETKIWRDKERYLDGVVELASYLDSQGYSTGYYILFDNTQGQNIVVKEQGFEIYDISYEGYTIHCFFVKINPVAPSKKRRGK